MESPMDKIAPYLDSVPVNIEGIIRTLGLSLEKNKELPPKISGHIKLLPSGGYEIASAKADHYFRQRFTMAHELGHFILHENLLGNGTDDDTKYRSTEKGDLYNTAIELVHEKQANSFAASILMPEELVRKLVEGVEERPALKQLAITFQVSPSAMRWRINNLGLADEVDDV